VGAPPVVLPASRPARARKARPEKPEQAEKQSKTSKPGKRGETAAGQAPASKGTASRSGKASSKQAPLKEDEEGDAESEGESEEEKPTPPEPLADELAELRKFEEGAFPRAGVARPPAPSAEGGSPPGPPPRPGTEHPRDGQQTHPLPSATRPPPPAPWLAKLQLPDLPVRWDPKLVRYLQFYRTSPQGRAIMGTWLKRLGRYESLITRALKKHGLPRALIHVAMIESGFNPKVTSRAGAAGIWQFMPKPGQGYGLQRDHWVDERRNPERSTDAAVRYLKDLHDRFGSWELALASYNAGYGGVTRAIQKYNTNDYWQLCRYEAGMPWETALYVPKILAAAVVGVNRSAFGYDAIKPEPELAHALVAVPASLTLAQAAQAAGVAREAIEALNPELRRGRTPPVAKAWLRVPPGSEGRFYAGLAALKGQLARHRPYLVRLGEGLKELAKQYGITVAALRALNGMERSEELRPGVTILLPARASLPAKEPVSEGESEEPILVGVPADRPSALPGRLRVYYRIVPGDRLEEIAAAFGVGAAELASWNALDAGAKLVAGMVLQAFVSRRPDPAKVVLLDPKQVKIMAAGSDDFLSAWEERRGRKRLTYTVREGDTLSSLSRRFGLSTGSLMRINRLDRRATLKAGQTLIVYVELGRLQKKRSGPRAKDDPSGKRAERDDEAGDEAEPAKKPAARQAKQPRPSRAQTPSSRPAAGARASRRGEATE
jgi:membrane-bound lytic murein transglycosylase D